MGIQDKIKEIAYKENLKTNITIGTVLRYDSLNNLADVYTNTNLHLKNVPIENIPGIHFANIQPNDTVYIVFVDNSISHPKIIAKADEVYAYNTRVKERHLRKGELIVSQKEVEGEIETPSANTWIDPENKNNIKYGFYFDKNSIEDADKEMYSQGNFTGQDVGMYSPTASSIVKIKEDGSINIFTETNTGIRINPKDKTIEILGNNLYTNADNWSIISNNIHIQADDTVSIKAKNLKINTDSMEVVRKDV